MRWIADDYMIIIVLRYDIYQFVEQIYIVLTALWQEIIIITSAADFQCNFFVNAVLIHRKIICIIQQRFLNLRISNVIAESFRSFTALKKTLITIFITIYWLVKAAFHITLSWGYVISNNLYFLSLQSMYCRWMVFNF